MTTENTTDQELDQNDANLPQNEELTSESNDSTTPTEEGEVTPEITNEKEAEEVVFEQPVAEKPKKAKTSTSKEESVEKHDDFDWDMDVAGFSAYSEKDRKEIASQYEGTFNQVVEKQVAKGRVVAINDRDVVINIGFKSDGMVSRQEFRDRPDLKVGDEVEVFVDTAEDAMGQLILSHRKALQETAWDRIIKANTDDEIVTGYVRSRTKGGLVVDIFGIDTFLPGSQIDIKPIRDYDQYVGKNMEFKVVKVNDVYKNVVISHKVLIEDDIEAQKSEILGRLEKGQVLEGEVKNMTSFGVFVDLGGLDGLLHITDISWGRINHPEEVLKLGQKINVVVLDFDDEKKRISLGLKQLSEHPWDSISDEYVVGYKVKGKVVTVADYGAFIEIKPGVEGLIHVSEMSWSSHLRNPQDFMNVGDEVEAVILTIDRNEHKMSLGIKQLTPDPWGTIATKYPVGSKHKGIVKNLTNYGLFVELEEGVDGLVHVSDLSWNKKIKHPAEFVKKGDELEVIVLELDTENRRLSIGHKQLEENPWDAFEDIFKVGSTHSGTVVGINDKGASVQLQYGIEGFAPTRHIKKKDNSPVQEDEVMEFEVIEFSKEQKRIILSHTNLWKSEEKSKSTEATRNKEKDSKKATKNVRYINQSSEKSTLGEMDVLSQLKAKMENAEKDTKPAKAAPKAEVVKDAEEPKAETKTKKVAKKDADTGDDLKKLSGVGPAFAKRLNALGINSFADVSGLTDAKIEELEKQDSMTSLDQWHKWIEEAKDLINS